MTIAWSEFAMIVLVTSIVTSDVSSRTADRRGHVASSATTVALFTIFPRLLRVEERHTLSANAPDAIEERNKPRANEEKIVLFMTLEIIQCFRTNKVRA
jgi:hypothetical protein